MNPTDVFDKIKIADPGKPTEKAAISEKDSIANKVFEEVSKGTYGTQSSPLTQQVPHSQYEKGFIFGEDPETHFAQRQGKLAELGNASARVALNIVPGILGSIGGIADIPDWFAGLNDQNEEVGNALTRWSNQVKQQVNEEVAPIYQQDQTPGIHLGSSEWWFDKGSGVVESAAEFAALGFGMGSLITKGLSAAKWLTAVDAATGGVKLNALGQTIGVGTNAFALNQAESILDATQTYDDELKKNMELVKEGKLTEHEAKVNASQAAAHVVNLDRINILLNLSSVGAIMRGSRGSRALKSIMNPIQRTALEGGQEYLEETVNYFAGQRALEMGEAKRKGVEYTGPSFSKLIEDMTSAQGVEAGFLGMLGGVAQTGIVETVQSVKGTNKAEKDWIAQQQAIGKSFQDVKTNKKLSQVEDIVGNLETHTRLVKYKEILEADIADAVAKGEVPAKDKVVALAETEYNILAAQAHRNFAMGTTDYLEKAYQDIAALSDEQAKENGFTEDQLNPKSKSYFKTKAQEALSTIKTLEKAYNKAEGYMNAPLLFKIKASEHRQEHLLTQAKQELAEKAIEANQAITALSRKTIAAPGVNTAFTLEQIGEVETEQDFSRQAVLKKAAELEPVKQYEKLRKDVTTLEDELDLTRQMYAEQTSDKVQKELQAKKKEELKQKEAVLKKVQATAAKIKQANTVKEASKNTVTAAVAAQDADSKELRISADEVQAIAEKAFENGYDSLTPEEKAFVAVPKHKEWYDEFFKLNTEFKAAKTEAKQDKVKAEDVHNPPTTVTEVQQILGEVNKFAETTMDTELVGKQDAKGKLHQAYNVLAWLARVYTKAVSPSSMLKNIVDVNNQLNPNMIQPLILDNRYLDVGDKVTLQVQDGYTVIPDQNEDEVPIVVKKGDDIVAWLHVPDWIKDETTQANVAQDQMALRMLRKQVIAKGKIATKIKTRTYGKLSLRTDRIPQFVNDVFKNQDIDFGMYYSGSFTNAKTTEAYPQETIDKRKLAITINNKKKVIVNRELMQEGRSYALVPIRHAKDNKPEEVWAIPLVEAKLSADLKNTAVKAVEIFYKATVDQTGITEDEKVIIEAIKAANKHVTVGDSPVNFDIKTAEGLNNFLSLFMYSKHRKEGMKGEDVKASGEAADISLGEWLQISGVTSDYHAMEVSPHGVFFGWGGIGVVPRKGMELPAYMEAFSKFLEGVYTHTNLDRLGSQAVVSVIKPEGGVVSLNDKSYVDFLKQHVWKTNILEHNISKDPAAPNYVYAVQQIIEVETDNLIKLPAETPGKAIMTPEGEVITEKKASTSQMSALLAAASKKLGKPVPQGNLDDALEADLPLEQLSEEAYTAIKDRYRIPGIKLEAQESLINWIATIVNEAYDKQAAEGSGHYFQKFDTLLNTIKAEFQKIAAEESDPSHKFYKKLIDEWTAVARLAAYNLETNHGYKIVTDDIGISEEAHALNPWSINSLEKDPTSSLTSKFRRFLAKIDNPAKPSYIGTGFDKMNPNALYRHLSSILADTVPNFDVMMEKLQQYVQELGADAVNSPIPELIKALKEADEQIQTEFVVTASKHYVNMQHLYITPVYANTNHFLGYDGYIRNDNAAAKISVTLEEWKTNLKMEGILTIPADDDAGTLMFDKKAAGEIAEQFLSLTPETFQDFDISGWLRSVGIKLHNNTLENIKKNGIRINKKTSIANYEAMFSSKSSPFRLIADALKQISVRERDVVVENSAFMKDRFWRTLANADIAYSTVSHSYTHRSGDKYIFSYADNKYLTDRFKELKTNINLLTQLADRSFSQHSWWLKGMLKTKTNAAGQLVFERDEAGQVILDLSKPLSTKFALNYVSLQAMKEKGVKESKVKALEDLSDLGHEKAKMMFFQNTGEVEPGTKERIGEFFLMTLSNKNTMLTVQSTIPKVGLDTDGDIDQDTTDLLFRNIVLPEMQRMWDYNDNHNINSYTEGHSLFYFFPALNKLDLFNEDNTLKPDAAVTYKAEIDKVIKDTLRAEINYKLAEWKQFKFIQENSKGEVTNLKFFDRSYQGFVRSKLNGSKTTDGEVAYYAAAEMAVGYMMINTNIFQTISTDPATQWKSKTKLDKIQQVKDTFDNITKRLGGEISPGRDLSQRKGETYRLAVIQDVYVPSKVLDKVKKITGSDAYANINSTDAVEFITVEEKLRFMRQSGKLTPKQIKLINSIETKLYNYHEAVAAGEDPSIHDLDLKELGLIFQVDKPIMVGTRVDANVETKIYVKSAAFTLIPQLLRGTELAKLDQLMYDQTIDRLAFASAVKLGAPKNIAQVFDEEGNFIEGSSLGVKDIFEIDRKYLRLQQEEPVKTKTVISRVSQASKLLFVDILDKTGFKLFNSNATYTAKELNDIYNDTWHQLYKTSYEDLLKELAIDPANPGDWNPSLKALTAIINKELRKRNYPPQDLDALGLEEVGTDTKTLRFKIAPWALAKSGKLEAFLNAIVDSRIVDQEMNGYSFILASEIGFKFTKPDTEKRVLTDLKELKSEVQSQIVFTDKFDTELKPAAANNGYHQVVIPWKYKEQLSDYITDDNKLDTSKFDIELLKAFGMRIPNQGPNSTAAIEIVGFLPPEAGDMIIAPADFVVQMGSDFDIDKLYVYLANYDKAKAKTNKLVKVEKELDDKKAFLQNRILDVHLSINTNMDKDIQKSITNPLESEELREIANEIAKIEASRVRVHDVNMLSPISSSYQSNKYVNSTVASTAIGAFAVQNTFNALAQTVPDLKLVKAYKPDGSVVYSKIKFGKHVFNGETDFSKTETLDGKSKKSMLISALLSAAVDDEKLQILSKIGINKQNISMANLLVQAGFDLETVSYFLKQDIIQEYCKQLSISGNSQVAMKAVLAMPQFTGVDKQYLEWKPGKTSSGMSEADQANAAFQPLTPEEIAEEESPVKSKWGEMYNPSVATMKVQLALGDKAPDYVNTQYAILKKFINLADNEVKTLRQVQGLLNTDTKGPGKNMFESLAKEEALEKLAGSKLENALQLFGDFVSKMSVTAEEQTSMKAAGYIETNNTLFMPTTIPGFAMAYGVITNNRLWSKHFPYSYKEVNDFFKEISKELDEKARDFTEDADRNRRLFIQLKQYVFTDNHIVPGSINETRRRLLYDFQDNVSIASIYQKLKEHPAIMSHKFLNNLFVVAKGANEPKVLLFKKPQDSEWSNFEIYSQVINSLKKPYKDPETGEVVTWEFNGKQYNTRTLIEDIMLAARLSGTSGLQQDMLQFLPVDYMTLTGIAEGVNTYDWKSLLKGKTADTASRPVIQYFQHYPQLTQTIEKISDIAYPNPVTITLEKPDGMENAPDVREVVQFTMLPEIESSVYGRRLGELPKFLHTERDEHLFMLTDAENRVYTRIPVLGTINNHEYNANTDFQSSNLKANNLPVTIQPVVERIEHSRPEGPRGGTLLTQKNYQDQMLMHSKYGVRAGEYHFKPEEVENLLNVIKVGDNEANKGVAEFLLKTLPKFNIKFQSTRTLLAGSDLPTRGKTNVNEDGSVTVQINFPVLWTAESLELTVLHELVHAVTIAGVMMPGNESQKDAVGRLTRLFESYKDKYYAGKDYEVLKDQHKDDPKFIELVYPTRNLKEFVVAVLTQPEFRERLQSLKYNDEFTFWDKLKAIFKKLLKAFGVDPDSTTGKAMQDILRLTEPPKGPKITKAPQDKVPPAPEQDSYSGGKVFSADAFKNAKKNPKMAKLMELLKDIPEADPNDLNADLPLAPESPKGKYGKLIAEKKAHINQLRKRLQELNIEKDEATSVKERADIEKRKDRIDKRIKDLSVEIEAADSAVKLEDLIPLALQELTEVTLELPKGTALDYKDIEILNRKVNLWVNYSDNFLTDTEKLSEHVAEKFKDVLAKAKNLESNLENIKRQKVLQLAEKVTGKKLDAALFFAATKDISAAAALTLSLDNADQAMLQTLFEYIKQTETYSREEILERTEAFQELLNNVKGKENLTGKNLENFINEDGTIIMPFTHEYFQTKYEYLHNIKAQEDAGEHAKAVETRKAFRKWIKENEIVFDIRKLISIEGFENMFTEDAGKHAAELKNLVGEAEYNRKLARAKKLYDNYLADRQTEFANIAAAPITDEEKALGQAKWDEVNNMFDYLDYRNDVGTKFSNRGWKYIESTPRAVTTTGKATTWYSDKYKALRTDADVAALHDHVINLLVQLRRYLPENVAKEFNINSLPALQKNLIETLKTEGLSAAVTHMWDGAKSKISSKDLGNELYGASVDADRYLTVNIQTLTNKITELYNQKRNDYMRVNDLTDSTEITDEVDTRLKEEATEEVKSKHTLDLKAILGIYTAAVVDYRHKSRIEDAVRLVEDVFNKNIKEIKTNASDEPYMRVTGRQRTVETTGASPKNLRNMLAYTLDRFYKKPRLVEGKTDKKVYSSTENIRKKALEEELLTYKGELAAAEENGTKEQKEAAQVKIKIVEAELNKLGSVQTGTGWADALLQYIMIKGLGWNPFSGLTNLGFGTISNLTEAAGGHYFNEEQILQGYKTVMSSVGKFWTAGTLGGDTALKVRTLMDRMDVFKRPSEEIYKDKAAVTGIAESLHWAHIQNRTEYLNQAPVMVAMMLGYKLTKKDGTESNLWAAYGKDGKWDTENFGDIRTAFPVSDRAKFQARVGEAIRKTHGNYDPNAPVRIKGTILGRMASVFRTWMFEGFNTRFEKESENYITGNKRKGRYRSYGGGSLVLAGAGLGTALLPGIGTGLGLAAGTALSAFMKKSDRYKDPNTSQFDELIAESKYLVRKMSLGLMFKKENLEDVFNSTDAQNMRKNMTELSLMMLVMGVAMVLKGLKDDEEDEDVRNILTYQLNVMHRLQQDIAFYAEPMSFFAILRDPIPATSTIEDTAKWLKAAGLYLNGEDVIPTGQYAGQSRLNRATGKLVPGWKQAVTTQDLLYQER
jgi:hypothetical protein